MKSKYDTAKVILIVDTDWSSTGIWIRESDGIKRNMGYERLNLPPWLVARFEYWTWWYNRWEAWTTGADEREPDEILFEAYGYSLAIDLKRVVGGRYHVEFRDKEIVLPSPKDIDEVIGHLSPATQPKDTAWTEFFPISDTGEETNGPAS
jgi:hypothetical protein